MHVGLIINPAFYANLSGITYTRPTEPGPYTTHGASDMELTGADANSIHKEEHRMCNLDNNVDNALEE